MTYAALAITLCFWSQAPGSADDFAPIRVPSQRAAPPADLGEMPPDFGAPAAGSSAAEPQAPADDWDIPAAGDPPVVDRYAEPERPAAGTGAARSPAAAEPPSGPLETLGSQPRQKLRPPELIAQALENPNQPALVGTPLTLAQALARAAGRQQQLEVTQVYWQLAAAQADYYWALEQRDLLEAHTGGSDPGTQGARAASEADVRDAMVQVEHAQARLAALVGAGGNGSAPLASDRPHVGDYRTYYENIFGNRPPPARIRLIQRTMPLRRKAIDAHAEAIVASLDAVQATAEQFRATGQGLATLLAAIDLLKQERRAFIDEVRAYNLDIADYALAVAPAGVGGDTLVSMLIRTGPSTGKPTRAAGPTPTLRKTLRPSEAADQGASRQSTADEADWTVHYAQSAADDPAMYQGLLNVASAPVRVQKLGYLLHWDRTRPTDSGDPLALADCLRGALPQRRLEAIRAFWNAREQAARFQVLSEQQQQLDALQAIAIAQREQAGMAEAVVRLQAARRATRAALLDAEVELLAAQIELMEATGGAASNWRWPATPPQAGRYAVSPAAHKGSSQRARWARQIDLHYDKLTHRAQAVIQTDVHRSQLVLAARGAGRASADDQMTPLDRVIWSVGRQNEQTLGFLDDLTEYNMAIANYVLVSQPANLSADELAGKLALRRSTLRDS